MKNAHHRLWIGLVLTATLTTSALAQQGGDGFDPGFGGGGGGGFPGFNDTDPTTGNPAAGGDGGGGGGGGGVDDLPFDNAGPGFDIGTAMQQRMIHGILASVAFVILFPLGAVALRFIPGKGGFWVHAFTQMAGWVLFVVAAAYGFVLVREVRVPGSDVEGWLIYDPATKYHPIIGIVVFILIAFQPALGYLHHRQFKLYQRRTVFSHLHLWNGRILIILGIVNGALGLKVSNAPDMATLAYTIVAAILGGGWLAVTLLGEVRRLRGRDVFGRFKREGVKGVWRRDRGRTVRMERIDKAVRAGSEDGGHGTDAHIYE